MSKPIKDFMTVMPHTIGHDMTATMAREMMQKHSCHHLPVLDGGHLVGVISDRDLQVISKLSDGNTARIEDIMTEEPIVIDGDMDVFQAAMLMHEKKIGSVIISANENHPWGIFTATDALNYLANK